jgi:hypothetical protein
MEHRERDPASKNLRVGKRNQETEKKRLFDQFLSKLHHLLLFQSQLINLFDVPLKANMEILIYFISK